MQDRGADGVEHLQAAARELLGAARAFLDVVEQVVEDPDRMSGAASAVGDLVRSGLGGVREQPWERSAWEDDTDGDGFGRERPDGWWDEPDEAPEPEPGPPAAPADEPSADELSAEEPAAEQAAAEKPAAKKPVAKKSASTGSTSSRVRRISVD